MKKLTQEQINTILENHKHWLNNDRDGWENMRADLHDTDLHDINLNNADLSYVDLRNANLSNADLSEAKLYYANLDYVNLSEANLYKANLCNANLCNANLRYADLSNVDLSYTNLSYANLRNVNLCNTNLSYADLSYSDLSYSDLNCTDLYNTNLRHTNLYYSYLGEAKNIPYIPMICPEEDEFIGWKKVKTNTNNIIVKLLIPSDAKRSSATTRKCKCNKAKVLEMFNLDGTIAAEREVHSNYDYSFIYKVGETIEVPNFDNNRWNECSEGIHFFINRQEAINYN